MPTHGQSRARAAGPTHCCTSPTARAPSRSLRAPTPTEPTLLANVRVDFSDFPNLLCLLGQSLLNLGTCCGLSTFRRAQTRASDFSRGVFSAGRSDKVSDPLRVNQRFLALKAFKRTGHTRTRKRTSRPTKPTVVACAWALPLALVRVHGILTGFFFGPRARRGAPYRKPFGRTSKTTDQGRNTLPPEPLPTLAHKILTGVLATITKICTKRGFKRSHERSSTPRSRQLT